VIKAPGKLGSQFEIYNQKATVNATKRHQIVVRIMCKCKTFNIKNELFQKLNMTRASAGKGEQNIPLSRIPHF
jgi:hypothetical protein